MAWLAGYTYRKKGAVNATTAGAQTNYQVKLLVGESSGASGEEIDCESHCHDFPNDIRFTAANGTTKHDYWVDLSSITGTTPNRLVTVQIEVASIPASSDVDLYIYYGKTSDSGESNGDNTFLFFDDFNALSKTVAVEFGLICSCESCSTKLQGAVTAFNSWSPDFVHEIGDFIDSTSENDSISDLQTLEAIYDDLTMNRYYGFGNHDLDWITKAQFMSYVGMSEKYYSFDVGDYHFIVLDPMYDSSNNDVEDCYDTLGSVCPYQTTIYVSDAEKTWLTNDLSGTSKKTFVFMEINLEGTQSIGNAAAVRTILENSNKVLAVFQANSGDNNKVTINGIPYYSMYAMDQAAVNAYAKITIYTDNSIHIEGIGEQSSYWEYNPTKWTERTGYTGVTLVSNPDGAGEVMKVGPSGTMAIKSDYTFTKPYAVEAKVRASTNANCGLLGILDDWYGVGSFRIVVALGNPTSGYWGRRINAGAWTDTGVAVSANTWYKMKFLRKSDHINIYADETSLLDTANSDSHGIFLLRNTNTKTVWADNFFVRKYVTPEPTWGSWGTEEETPLSIPIKMDYYKRLRT